MQERWGLGVGSLWAKNRALLGKWWWRFKRAEYLMGESHKKLVWRSRWLEKEDLAMEFK